MSQPFTYALDEQLLRTQLQSLQVAYKEDAWHKFEAYSNAQAVPAESGALQRLSLQFNRQLVLPVAFGSVVLIFSLLLFNFVSIKDPQRADVESSPVSHPVVPAPDQSQQIIPGPEPVQQNDFKTVVKNSEAVKTTEPSIQKEIESAEKQSDTAPELASAAVADESAISAEDSAKKRRRRIRHAQTLEEIRPTMVTEDLEPEIRPN